MYSSLPAQQALTPACQLSEHRNSIAQTASPNAVQLHGGYCVNKLFRGFSVTFEVQLYITCTDQLNSWGWVQRMDYGVLTGTEWGCPASVTGLDQQGALLRSQKA